MKAFIDSSVLVAAVHSPGGVCRELVYFLAGNEPLGFSPVRCTTSQRVMDELVYVLVRKFSYTPQRAAEKADQIAAMLKITPATEAPAPGLDEPENWLLAEARASGCDYFITADRFVLRIYAVDGMRIVTPREVLDWIFMARPIPRFEVHEERAAYMVARLESVI